MINEQDLVTILERYKNSDLLIGVEISEKRIRNIMHSFPIPQGEEIFATVNATVFGSNKNGLVFGKSAIYANNDFTGGGFSGAMSYAEFLEVEIRFDNAFTSQDVFLGESFRVCLGGSQMSANQLADMMVELQNFLRTNTSSQQSNNETGVEEFWTAKNGDKFGPYALGTVKDMIKSGKLNPDADYIWKNGMAEWKVIATLPEFMMETTPPPPPPPPTAPAITRQMFLETPFEINEATEPDLLTLPGVDSEKAQRLIAYRNEHGQIKSFDTLRAILNVAPHEFEEIKAMVKITTPGMPQSGRMIDF